MNNFIKAQGERNLRKIYVRLFRSSFDARIPWCAARTDGHRRCRRNAGSMQKTAFEVAWRILRATPVNATALVSALLLTTRGVALTLDRCTTPFRTRWINWSSIAKTDDQQRAALD